MGSNALAGLAKSVGKYGSGVGTAFTGAPKATFPNMGQLPFTPFKVQATPSPAFPELSKQTGEVSTSPLDLSAIDQAGGTTFGGQQVEDTITDAEKAAGGFGGTNIPIVSQIPIVGQLIEKWTSLGRNKVAASEGINAASDYIWKDLYPSYEKGELPAEDFKKLADMALSDWANTLPQNVKRNSIEDQLFWFNEAPGSNREKYNLPFEFSIPGFSAVRHA
jgi:hypothetical protein